MDLLKAEISRKRKLNENVRNQIAIEDPAKIIASKYIRHGDRVKLESERLQQQQEIIDKKRGDVVHHSAMVSEIAVETIDSNRKHEYAHLSNLDKKDVKQRLRMLAQPITLFGESDAERLKRLLEYFRVEDAKDEYNKDESRIKSQKRKDGEDDDDDDDADDALFENDESRTAIDKGLSRHVDDDDDDDDHDDHHRYAAGISSSATTKLQHYDPSVRFSKIAGLSDEKIVYKFFRALLKQWEVDLNMREDKVKQTAKGKIETRTQKQCKDYIRPLFKMCKSKEVPGDILHKLVKIVQFCEDGNFRAANDAYISTAIGNAAWPIGLTMVGIHERSGREKISTSKVCWWIPAFC